MRAARALAPIFFVAACSGLPAETVDIDAGRGSIDAGALDAQPLPDDAALPPSPANLGWIGGACQGPADCEVAGGFCLSEGFPNGMCTLECSGLCPDRGQPGDTVSFCTDGKPFGFDQGLCVSRCDTSVLPGTGCPAGYSCLPENRYGEPETIVDVCVPTVPAGPCAGEDEIVWIDYPDKGSLWIPRELQCGGAAPLVVMLHGINPSSNPTPSLGGGRHLEYEVRALIDARLMQPVLLAEPVHFQGSSTYLYDADWDPATHLDLIDAELQPRGITLSSLSYTGHSGAGCDPDNGLFKVLAELDSLIPAYAPTMRLWGLEDICYGSYSWTGPEAVLPGTGIVLFNMYSVQGDPTLFEDNLFPDPLALTCSDALYTSCIASKVEPWCTYRTNGISHNANPYFFVREAFPQVFSLDPDVVPCR